MSTDSVVHVVDDDDAVRDSLSFLLSAASVPVRTYASASQLLDALPNLEAGCVVTDVRMPGMSGLELVRKLAELGVPHPVIVLTGHADIPLAVEAMKAGVIDFFEKPFDDEALLASIRSALLRNEESTNRAIETADIRQRLGSLTGREREVFDAVVAGHANKVVAFQLGISQRTVEVYRANVMTKMKANSLSDLVRMSLFVNER